LITATSFNGSWGDWCRAECAFVLAAQTIPLAVADLDQRKTSAINTCEFFSSAHTVYDGFWLNGIAESAFILTSLALHHPVANAFGGNAGTIKTVEVGQMTFCDRTVRGVHWAEVSLVLAMRTIDPIVADKFSINAGLVTTVELSSTTTFIFTSAERSFVLTSSALCEAVTNSAIGNARAVLASELEGRAARSLCGGSGRLRAPEFIRSISAVSEAIAFTSLRDALSVLACELVESTRGWRGRCGGAELFVRSVGTICYSVAPSIVIVAFTVGTLHLSESTESVRPHATLSRCLIGLVIAVGNGIALEPLWDASPVGHTLELV
jgi:hypothetical protein